MADNPVVSSSPLKMAQSSSGALAAYLAQYVDVATGRRVVLQGAYNYGGVGWYRFKCLTCHDNWNVGGDLFPTTVSLPKELTDWVAKHEHVCDSFHQNYLGSSKCSGCGWAWNKHKAAQPQYDAATDQWIAAAPGKSLPMAAGQQVQVFTYGAVVPTNDPKSLQPIRVIGRECVICQEELPENHISNICQRCFNAAKTVHEARKPATEGRMFRREERCELATDTGEGMSTDSAN